MGEETKGNVAKAGGAIAEAARHLTSETAKSAGNLASSASKKYEESGAKETVDTVTGKVSEQFDVVSGQAMFQAVQDYLAIQSQYNDALANKLLEALDRIKQLEEKIGRK